MLRPHAVLVENKTGPKRVPGPAHCFDQAVETFHGCRQGGAVVYSKLRNALCLTPVDATAIRILDDAEVKVVATGGERSGF